MLTFKNEMNIDFLIVNASFSILKNFRNSVGIDETSDSLSINSYRSSVSPKYAKRGIEIVDLSC